MPSLSPSCLGPGHIAASLPAQHTAPQTSCKLDKMLAYSSHPFPLILNICVSKYLCHLYSLLFSLHSKVYHCCLVPCIPCPLYLLVPCIPCPLYPLVPCIPVSLVSPCPLYSLIPCIPVSLVSPCPLCPLVPCIPLSLHLSLRTVSSLGFCLDMMLLTLALPCPLSCVLSTPFQI